LLGTGYLIMCMPLQNHYCVDCTILPEEASRQLANPVGLPDHLWSWYCCAGSVHHTLRGW